MEFFKTDSDSFQIWNSEATIQFDIQGFEGVISQKVVEKLSMDFQAFRRTIIDKLDKHAQLKKISKGPSF